uniref:Uncharacterized protein n=1 Tax=Anguilla anguilla TaxID=7936 RepID=A0A0E9SQM5_ANGAN
MSVCVCAVNMCCNRIRNVIIKMCVLSENLIVCVRSTVVTTCAV